MVAREGYYWKANSLNVHDSKIRLEFVSMCRYNGWKPVRDGSRVGPYGKYRIDGQFPIYCNCSAQRGES